jgi:hypothetical protein
VADLSALKERQLAAGERVLEAWMRAVVGEGARLAPIEEGTLRGSGDVEVERLGDVVEATGYFAQVYAARQHEELDWAHPKGGQAKYLEEPFKRNLPRLEPLVGAAVRAVSGG